MQKVPEIFGSMVFNDSVMREKLPKDTYKSLHKTIEDGRDLDINVANAVATAMKDWAIEKGATHFTHWFQPMTGITAEKHDSFLSPQPDGHVIMEFTGKELIKGEPDASSFPSGGLRATFEARGYTAWDPTSYAFIKDDSLCVPTVFCSYSGEVLDKKTPLLRSNEIVGEQALRVLKLFGSAATRVTPDVGPEQEYFLIDKALFDKRLDLKLTGRTLFGAKPPKGQELDDHYFGSIKPRVKAFMKELDEELWKLGVFAKTEHNEVAPAQHELAPVYSSANTATDHNQLTMEMMKKVADRHSLACLLHEKPFDGVNGSGKHNNWSLTSNLGEKVFDPGKKPSENKRFLLFVSAVIKAVDEHQDLIRITSAGAGNDHRLGASEAPPAIVSIFLGDELTKIFDSLESGSSYEAEKAHTMMTGVNVLPDFRKDTTDRNRTSPFAFTGNKFEFRMLGSSFSTADPNTILNTITADVLSDFADRLENAEDFDGEVQKMIAETYREHKRIVFNGNNYSPEWVDEAKRRGLLNLKTTADAIPYFIRKENIELFKRHKIFSESEIYSRFEILLENYCKVLKIEASTMLDITRRQILPAVLDFGKSLAESAAAKKSLGLSAENSVDFKLMTKVDTLALKLDSAAEALSDILEGEADEDIIACANYYRDSVVPAMAALRAEADALEAIVGEKQWPFPTYRELLFYI